MTSRAALALVASVLLLGCTERPAPLPSSLADTSPKGLGPGSLIDGRDEAGRAVTLRVEAEERDAADADGDLYLYQLSVRDAAGAWQRYCAPDRAGGTLAIPLEGYWDAARNHVADPGVITFACTNGSLAKCARMGYKPWKTVNGVSLAGHHQACVHLVAADYCGDGTPHTREGTRVDIWDRLGIQKRESEPGQVFEAAWAPRGAVYLNKPRYGETLESLVAACPDRLGGRTRRELPELDEAAIVARWPEALLFTESLVQTALP